MDRDPVRETLRERLWQAGLSLAEASLALGRNKAYLQQYLARGMPRVLSYRDSETLGELLGCDPAELRHDALPPPKPWRKKPGPGRPRSAPVAEVEVEAAAGRRRLERRTSCSRRRAGACPRPWCATRATPTPERIAHPARCAGAPWSPSCSEGDRLVVDTARTGARRWASSSCSGTATGLVVKRVEARAAEAARLRLVSANPDYPPYERDAGDVHIVGRVLWKVTRA